ncbi:helix-turn-helix transcriptional regulator [Glutamicibacter sp. FBE19]|nr:helix-turn-helix transcriptional regulator [Glutamicibacter sp. FBE19]
MTITPERMTKQAEIDRRMGLEIKGWLARKELRQADLGSALGLSQGAVSQRLVGKVSFSVEELMKVSGLLNITFGQLIGQEILNEKGPDPRNADQGLNELLQLDLNQQPFD